MLNFEITPASLTMSSREIAELTGKEHKNVLADIRSLLEELGLNSADFSAVYKDQQLIDRPCFNLPKRETLILVSGYNIQMRARIIDRWQQLESQQATPLAIPDFSNPAAAARAWADQYEARLHAERTKALIGSKREATAMATASAATRKAEQLLVQLDRAKEYATVKRIEACFPGHRFDWRMLKNACAELGLKAIDVFDQNYGTVKAYPAKAWEYSFAVLLTQDGAEIVR